MRRVLGFLIGIALIVAIAALTGCATTGTKPAPTIVQVPVTRYVPIPGELTAPCDIAEPQALTVGEAVRVARERKAALQRCNADKAQIQAIQGTEAKK